MSTTQIHYNAAKYGQSGRKPHVLSIGRYNSIWIYTFSAKERDPETGYSYFGSRYYSSDLSIWLSVDPMSDKYPSLSPYVYCANNPVKLVDPNGEEIGKFYTQNGKYLGTDNIDDGKIYIVKNTSCIKTKSAFSKALQNNTAYCNSVEIEGSKANRQKMVDIVRQDDGKGGSAQSNNREYGGVYDKNGNIIELPPGPVGDLSKTNKLEFDGSAIFHSHASGTYLDQPIDVLNPSEFNTLGGKESEERFWIQEPSEADMLNAGNTTRYVFGRRNDKVYIYNGSGIQATMKTDTFLNIDD